MHSGVLHSLLYMYKLLALLRGRPPSRPMFNGREYEFSACLSANLPRSTPKSTSMCCVESRARQCSHVPPSRGCAPQCRSRDGRRRERCQLRPRCYRPCRLGSQVRAARRGHALIPPSALNRHCPDPNARDPIPLLSLPVLLTALSPSIERSKRVPD